MPITIRDVQVITTKPGNSNLVIVKVLTSEPGLYGLGCATFTQRWHAVVTAVEKHLRPFALGRDVMRGEEFFRMAMAHSYWRNGPVLNNAISGVDQALWDIRGKLAGMPVYELLGGKLREAANVYVHADGSSPQEVAENVQRYMEQGHRHIRVQMGGYGGQGGAMIKPEGAPSGSYYDPRAYCRDMLNMIEHVRRVVGDEVELLHDIHERLHPVHAIQFANDVEAISAVLPRGRACAGRHCLVPAAARSERRAVGNGGALQQSAGVAAPDRGAPHRFPAHAHQPDGRPDARAGCCTLCQHVWLAYCLARPG